MRAAVGRFLDAARKARVLAAYRGDVLRHPMLAARYVVRDREVTNFTYDLENVDEIASFVADALGIAPANVAQFVAELLEDDDLHTRLAERLALRRDRNPEPRFGRRVGWYAFVRALRPEVVVETGVHDGLGSAVLLRALERNLTEGHEGRLLGFDIDPRSGWLVDETLSERFELIVGDSGVTLEPALHGLNVGVFIHDSAHTYEHERREFDLALPRLAPMCAVLSDNAHVTSALEDFSRTNGLRYSFFRERPLGHFYPGAGIGAGVRSGASLRDRCRVPDATRDHSR